LVECLKGRQYLPGTVIYMPKVFTKMSLPYNLTQAVIDVMTAIHLLQGILSPQQVASIPGSTIEYQFSVVDQKEKEKLASEIKKVKANKAIMLEIAKKPVMVAVAIVAEITAKKAMTYFA
jgi:hypothetical protein